MKRLFKKVVAVAAVMAMCMSMVACSEEAATSESSGGGSSSSSSSGDTIKLGFVYPLTGNAPNIGAACKNGSQLAIDEINAAGGINGKQIEAVFEDDENKPATAPNAVTKLLEQDKVDMVLGSYASSCSIAMAPIVNEAKKIMISVGSTNAKVTAEGGEYIFRACFIDPLQGKVAATFAKNTLKADKVAMLYDVGKDYCVGISSQFKETFEADGGTIAYEGKYNTGDSDFKSYLTEIKNSGATVLYLPDDYDVVGLIAKQVSEIGLDIQLMSSDSCSDPALVEIGGDAVEGMYFTDHVSIQSDNLKDFVADYKEKFDADPGSFSVLGYDAVYIAKAAIEKAGSTDADAVKDALHSLDEKCGTTNYKFDENGDPIKSVVVNQVKDGSFSFMEEISPEE